MLLQVLKRSLPERGLILLELKIILIVFFSYLLNLNNNKCYIIILWPALCPFITFTLEMCKDFTSVINRTLATANNVKQQRHRYWLLKYLEERKNSYLEAMVIESGPKRINLVLTDTLMDIDLPASRVPPPEPSTLVRVKPVKVDPLDNSVRFDW